MSSSEATIARPAPGPGVSSGQEEEDFSLVVGGPLYQMYLRSRLVRPPEDLVERRIAAFIVMTWLPLLVLSLASGTALGGAGVPFLLDIDVHVRFLLALPLLIAAEVLCHQRIRVVVRQFTERGIVTPECRERFDEILASTVRLRNSAAIETVLIVGSITIGYFVWREGTALQVGSWYVAEEHLTLAGWWYAFVSLNLFRFVLLRWFFRLIIWYIFLARVARLPLHVNPLHPDRAGGIGFLGASAFAFTPVLLAQTVFLSGNIGNRILHEGMKLPAFQLEIGIAVALLMAIILVPLAFFVLPLASAKRAALREYGLLATRYVDGFREKWMGGSPPEGEALVGSADIQSLADLSGAYEAVRDMGVFPIGKQAIVRLAIVLALPFLPLTLTMIPFEELVTRIVGKLL